MVILIVLGSIVAVIAIYLIAQYNGLVTLRNLIQEAFSQIDVQLKRRNDLIPNLMETVKGYAKHEKEIFGNISQARKEMVNPNNSPQERLDAGDQAMSGVKSLFAISESYPDLKANQNFLQFQEQLVTTEDKIAFSRQNYNMAVTEFNIKRDTFPTNIVSGMLGFTRKEQLKTPEAERAVVDVKF